MKIKIERRLTQFEVERIEEVGEGFIILHLTNSENARKGLELYKRITRNYI